MKKKRQKFQSKTAFGRGVEAALARAAKSTREEARRHGLPIYVMSNGKIVAINLESPLSVVRRFAGHGAGDKLHEDPQSRSYAV